jgi:hypothetical protein
MEWISPTSELGTFIYSWFPKATRGKHYYAKNIKIKNVWKIDREPEQKRFQETQAALVNKLPSKYEIPLHQPNRPDLSKEEQEIYKSTNTCLLMHGSRTVNTLGLLREGFRFPKELVGVPIAGAMFSGGADGKRSRSGELIACVVSAIAHVYLYVRGHARGVRGQIHAEDVAVAGVSEDGATSTPGVHEGELNGEGTGHRARPWQRCVCLCQRNAGGEQRRRHAHQHHPQLCVCRWYGQSGCCHLRLRGRH